MGSYGQTDDETKKQSKIENESTKRANELMWWALVVLLHLFYILFFFIPLTSI